MRGVSDSDVGQGGGTGVDKELGARVYFEDRLCLYLKIYQFMGRQLGLECVTLGLGVWSLYWKDNARAPLLPFSTFCSAYSAYPGGVSPAGCLPFVWLDM